MAAPFGSTVPGERLNCKLQDHGAVAQDFCVDLAEGVSDHPAVAAHRLKRYSRNRLSTNSAIAIARQTAVGLRSISGRLRTSRHSALGRRRSSISSESASVRCAGFFCTALASAASTQGGTASLSVVAGMYSSLLTSRGPENPRP